MQMRLHRRRRRRQTPPTPVHSDVADAGTEKDSENDEEHRDFTEADVVK